MPTERIEIVVTERGTREVKRNLEEVGNSANKTGGAISFLRKALLLLGATAVAKKLLDFVDVFTNLQNRIRTVTSSMAELNVLTEELFGIAQRTRSSMEATTEVFTRTALAVRELGISQKETLQFTESLNQAVLLSGATTQEATAGLIQLSQGLASGALRGDELRSVLEQLPAVADVIAKSLGVTRGELRKMGEEGRITSDVILKAFRESREELQERFSKSVVTIGQSFTVLRNSLIKTFGEFDKSIGLSQKLAKGILLIAENADILVRSLAAVSITLGVVFAQVAVGKAITAIRALTLAIAANPIGAIAVAITATIAALIAFSDQILITSDSFVTLQDFGVAAFTEIRIFAEETLNVFRNNFGFIAELFKNVFGDVEISIKGILKFMAGAADRQIGLFVGTANAIITAFEGIGPAIKNIFSTAFQSAITIAGESLNKIIATLNKLPGVNLEFVQLEKFNAEAPANATDLGKKVKDAFLTGFGQNTISDVLDKTFQRAEQVAKDRLANQAKNKADTEAALAGLNTGGPNVTPRPGTRELQEHLKLLAQEGQLLKLNALEREQQKEVFKIEKDIRRELTTVEAESVKAQVAENQALAVRSQLLQDIQGPQEQLMLQQQELNKLLAEGSINAEQYGVAMNKLQIATLAAGTTAAEGFKRGFLQIKGDILNVADAAENVLTNAFSSAEDALVKFVTTGEFSFSNFVDGILADLTRLLAKQALAALINAFAGAAGGGGVGSIFTSLLGGAAQGAARADGGPVNSGRAFLVGEQGPELFVPKSAGQVMPNESLTNMAAAPPPQVNVQVINVTDPNEVPEAMASQRGDKVFLNSVTRNRNAFRAALGVA